MACESTLDKFEALNAEQKSILFNLSQDSKNEDEFAKRAGNIHFDKKELKKLREYVSEWGKKATSKSGTKNVLISESTLDKFKALKDQQKSILFKLLKDSKDEDEFAKRAGNMHFDKKELSKLREYVSEWGEKATSSSGATNVLIGIGVGVSVGIGLVAAAPVVLGVVGFSSSGVVAGSIAAAWQSSIGSVAAGSLFASLQSAGAVGAIAAGSQAAIVGTSAVVGAAGGGIVNAIKKDKNNDGKEDE